MNESVFSEIRGFRRATTRATFSPILARHSDLHREIIELVRDGEGMTLGGVISPFIGHVRHTTLGQLEWEISVRQGDDSSASHFVLSIRRLGESWRHGDSV